MKNKPKWSKEKKIKLLRVLIALLVIIAISVSLYFVFRATGITNVDKLQSFIQSTGAWSVVVYLLVYIAFTTLLSFVPGASMTFILIAVAMFGANWKTFLICFSGVVLASVVMDLIGRFGGSKLIKALIGKEDYESAMVLVQEKGMVYVPVMYLLPVFPDDAICMVVGATKMKFITHLIEIILCRGVGCATIVFGINILPENLLEPLKKFDWGFIGNHFYQYFELFFALALCVVTVLIIARVIDKHLSLYLKKKALNKALEDNNQENNP